MKAIVTRQNPDGTYDEVGMNNRIVVGPFKRERTVFLRAFTWARGRSHRVETFAGDSILGSPNTVRYVKGTVAG